MLCAVKDLAEARFSCKFLNWRQELLLFFCDFLNLVFLGCARRGYSAPKALPTRCRSLTWKQALGVFRVCWNTFQNTPGLANFVLVGHRTSWGVLCKMTSCEIICCGFIDSKSLHLLCKNELGKIWWCIQAAPKLPCSLSILCARGTLSFWDWKVAQDGQRWPCGTSLPGWRLFLLCPWACSSRGLQNICNIKKKIRKAAEKRNATTCGNLLDKLEFTRLALLAPGPLCRWISAPF